MQRDRSVDGPISARRTDLAGAAQWLRAAAVGVCLVGVVAGCSGGAGGGGETQAVRLVVPDANIREPADPCSGARAFRYAHPEAPYELVADGDVLAAGALPEGRAEKAFSIDLGTARQPTVCVMSIEVPASVDLADAELTIDGHGPVPIEPNPALDDAPEAVLR
ncbi:hypothetical protein [Promicromonospora sp. NPDC059942]|uniref:hypothetical protein n=1 Tax=Promicromonospora sp. NPDC059942 TaxID=3347009 RepID=UPI003646FDE2